MKKKTAQTRVKSQVEVNPPFRMPRTLENTVSEQSLATKIKDKYCKRS